MSADWLPLPENQVIRVVANGMTAGPLVHGSAKNADELQDLIAKALDRGAKWINLERDAA